MHGRVLIVGQGLAGTALGLSLEAAGVEFAIASDGHARAASRVAAGLVNPVTGQRWVKTAAVDETLALARERYEAWGRELGVALWHPLRLTRLYRDAAERDFVRGKIARGELAPYATAASEDGERGAIVEGAAWVDLPALLAAAAARWRERGGLRERVVEDAALRVGADGVEWGGEKFSAVVLCTGSGALARGRFAFAPFAAAKGEMIAVRGATLARDTALSRGTWMIGGPAGTARVGATYERGREDDELTATARAWLRADAEALAGAPLEVVAQSCGVRLALADRLPVVGWHPRERRLGIFGGLGSKGTLWAPRLADAWARELRGGCGATDAAAAWPGWARLGRF